MRRDSWRRRVVADDQWRYRRLALGWQRWEQRAEGNRRRRELNRRAVWFAAYCLMKRAMDGWCLRVQQKCDSNRRKVAAFAFRDARSLLSSFRCWARAAGDLREERLGTAAALQLRSRAIIF